MIDRNPQSIEQLQVRYPAAVAEVYDVVFMARLPEERASNKPKHIFDYDDGPISWRLIISIDRAASGEIYLHVSASCNVGIPFPAGVLRLFNQIRLDAGPLVLHSTALSPGGVLYLFLEPPQQPSPQAKGERHGHN